MIILKRAKIQEMRGKIDNLSKTNEKLAVKIQEYSSMTVNLLAELENMKNIYKGNAYTSYATAVEAIAKKYNCESLFGVCLTSALIQAMSSFTCGQGFTTTAITDGEADAEIAFVNELLDHNNLDEEGFIEIINEAMGIEGKLLLHLIPEPDYQWQYLDSDGKEVKKTGMVKIRFVPWRKYNYTILTPPDDYLTYTKAKWSATGTLAAGSIDENKFVYRKFGGDLTDPNRASMKIWKCLTEIDMYDECKSDWRKINKLFASPTPHFEMENMDLVEKMNESLVQLNWRIGKMLSHIGKFQLTSASMEGIVSIEKEKVALQKIISGATGIPVHFFEPEVMSNKRLAENEMEFVWASFNLERNIIKGAFDEIIRKSMALQVEQTNEKLDSKLIKNSIRVITDADWQRLKDFFLPLLRDGNIDRQTVLEKIPGIDVAQVLSRLSDQEDKDMENVKTGFFKVPGEIHAQQKSGFPPDQQQQNQTGFQQRQQNKFTNQKQEAV